jgi:hypothetical protein
MVMQRDKRKKIREALKNAIVPGRTRTGSNAGTLVAEGETKRSVIGELVRRIIIHSTGAMFIITSAKRL